MMILVQIAVYLLVIGGTSKATEVCYGDLGCFSNDPPFNNAVGLLPRPPEVIGPSFYIYTKFHKTRPIIVDYTEQDEVIPVLDFDPSLPIRMVAPAYKGTPEHPLIQQVKDDFLSETDLTFIIIEWNVASNELRYHQSVADCRVVGPLVARFVKALVDLRGVDLKKVTIQGVSLAAQLISYIGKSLPGIGRITGLDPALTGSTDAPETRLTPNDALFVDIIHTDWDPVSIFGCGYPGLMGHADFFVNGGYQQPGCPSKALSPSGILCSHQRAAYLYVASVKLCRFPTTRCPDLQAARRGECYEETEQLMAEGVRSDLHGIFYVKTTSTYPFCAQ